MYQVEYWSADYSVIGNVKRVRADQVVKYVRTLPVEIKYVILKRRGGSWKSIVEKNANGVVFYDDVKIPVTILNGIPEARRFHFCGEV